ncbi:MAG: neutral zinc metallopeptidase [Prevotellaceae bacterium]|nr:neutral zinc metallopeptidase [Prevotellaceae bacterium]
MKLDGRRESTNVDDRRRMGGGTKAGMGLGGIVIAALIAWMMGGNPLDALQQAGGLDILTNGGATEQEITPEQEELAKFSKQILAGTEDVWTKIFREKYGREYSVPGMVLFTGSVQSACGAATAQVGPFYCSGDQRVYLDLTFFSQMRQQLGAGGDFAYAYVIAHEVGHHVQYLTGVLDQAHEQMARLSEKDANKISVRLELLADFYAGIWGYYDNQMFGSLEDGDIEEAIDCAQKIGDNYLQQKAQGYTVPDSFTHGTSEQRMRWLKLGLTTGDLSYAQKIFQLPESEL